MSAHVAAPLSIDEAGRRSGGRIAVLAAVGGSVAGLAAVQGGYFPSAWGWATVPLLWAAAVAWVVRDDLRLTTAERTLVGGLTALVGWTALSAVWSPAPAASIDETERSLLYLAAVVSVLSIGRARAVRDVLGALLGAVCIVSAFSLATRLLPDRVGIYDRTGIYRLAEPLGYWNGLGLFASLGFLVALGFAARGRLVSRALGAAALVLLLPTLYFTFGRGAWVALAAGLFATVAVDPGRLQFLATLFAVGPAPALAVMLASREQGLTHPGTALSRAAHDGHRLALILLVLAAFNMAAAVAAAQIERRALVPHGLRRFFAIAVVAVAVAATTFGLVRAGGPVAVVRHAYAAFKAPPPHVTRDLNNRLLNLSGNGRADLWRIAIHQAEAHPLLGAGAGMYERYFLAHQPPGISPVRDAHSLYLEALAELGPLGLALLVVLLASPLFAHRRVRAHPLVPAAVGAYVAYLVHTGVDWDWELPAVTLSGLFCGVAILLSSRLEAPSRAVGSRGRWVVAGGAAAAALFAGITLIGNTALSRSEAARERGDIAAAVADARRARALLPWSPQPWAAIGRAEQTAGLLGDAQRSLRKAVSMDRGNWQWWYDLAGVTTGRAHEVALRHAAALYPQARLLGGAR